MSSVLTTEAAERLLCGKTPCLNFCLVFARFLVFEELFHDISRHNRVRMQTRGDTDKKLKHLMFKKAALVVVIVQHLKPRFARAGAFS